MSGNPAPAARLRRHLLPLAGAAAAIASAATGASAQAALISTGTCNDAALTAPFEPWGDDNLYELVPGGNFAGSLPGWTLGGGVRTVAGAGPSAIDAAAGSSSLLIPAGATVQTPSTCVNASYPTFRFFARDDSLTANVIVSVVYDAPLLGSVTVPVGTVTLSDNWAPSLPMTTLAAIDGLLSGGTTQVALRFTAVGGAAQIDDIYVDPRMT